MKRCTRGFTRWLSRCTRWTKRRWGKTRITRPLSPDAQMFMRCGMEVDTRGRMQPRPWHDPGTFRHFTRDIYGREVVCEYPRIGKPPEVTVLRQYARGGIL